MIHYPCPSPQRWRALLHDDLPPAEQHELDAHLESCPDCQRLLEDCAADRDSWDQTPPRYLGQSAPTRDQALRDVMDRLKLDPDDAPHAAALPVDFLDPSDRPGSLGRLGPYEILEEVGRGGMGVVLKALDPALHRVVAIKVLAPQLAVSATARKRFTREGRAAAAVCHEHVITIHAVEEFKGLPYLVMQYVAGLSLHEKLEQTGPLSVAEVLRIGMQTACGLAAAHAQGLIHRDVKPANILLENGVERVQLTDFSLARAVDDASVTQSGVVSGTPQYMAPEQARGEPLDARADLFSLGSVLYALCTGRPPFRGHALEVLRKVSEDTPKPIRDLNPEIPAWLEAIVMKLMAKEPGARFTSAAEVSDLLGRCLAHVQQPATVSLPAIPGHKPRQQHRLFEKLPPWLLVLSPFAKPSGPLPPCGGGLGWGVAKPQALACLPPTPTLPRKGGGRKAAAACFVGILALAACLLASVILRFTTPDGTLIVEIDDPEVQVSLDGRDMVITGVGMNQVRLTPGTYTLHTAKAGQTGADEIVTIKRGEKQVVKVSFEPAARAVDDALRRFLQGEVIGEATGGTTQRFQAVAPTANFANCRSCHPNGDPSDLSKLNANELHSLEWMRTAKNEQELDKARTDWRIYHAYRTAAPAGTRVTTPARIITPAFKEVGALAFTNNGKLLAVADDRRQTMCVFDVVSGEQVMTTKSHGQLDYWLVFSPSAKILITASHSATRPTYWRDDITTGKRSEITLAREGHIHAVAFTPDEKTLAVGGAGAAGGGFINVSDGSSNQSHDIDLASPVRTLAFVPGRSDRVAVGTMSADIQMIDLTTGKVLDTLRQPGPIYCVTFSPDGRWLAATSGTLGHTRQVTVWDCQAGRQVATLRNPELDLPGRQVHSVTSTTFSPDGRYLLTVTTDSTAHLWDMTVTPPRLAITYALQRPAGQFRPPVFSPDGKTIVTAGPGVGGVLRFWDVPQPRPASPKRIAFHPPYQTWAGVFEWLSHETGLPYISQHRPPSGGMIFLPPKGPTGTIQDYTVPEMIDFLNEALMQQKFLLVRREKSFATIPADEKIDPALVPRVRVEELKDRGQTELVSVVVPLPASAGDDYAAQLRKLMGPFGEVIVQTVSKQLILRDTAGNLRRMIETINAPTPKPATAEKRVKFEFRNKSWSEVLDWFSQETGVPFIAPHKPTGTFTINPPPKAEGYTIPEVVDFLNEVLLQQQYILIRRTAAYTIVPADEPVDPAILPRVTVDELKDHGKTELVNVIYGPRTTRPSDLALDVKRMMGPFGVVAPFPTNNTLAMTDTVGNLLRIVAMLERMEKQESEKLFPRQFRDARWNDVFEWLSQQTGTAYVSSNQPVGTFTFAPTKEGYAIAEVMDILNESLRSKGWLLVRRETFFTVLPLDEPIPPTALPRVSADELQDRGRSEMITTTIVMPAGKSAVEMLPEVRKMLGPLGQAQALDPRRLMVYDTAESIRQIQETLRGQKEPAKRIRFEFRDKSWGEVLDWFGRESGLPFVGSKPTGTFTFVPPVGTPAATQGYTIPEVIDILNELLAQQRSMLIRREKSYIVTPSDEPIDAFIMSTLSRVTADELKDRGKTELVSLVYQLNALKTDDIVLEVKRMMGPFGVANSLVTANLLILTDTAGNLRRIVEMLDKLEKDKKGPEW